MMPAQNLDTWLTRIVIAILASVLLQGPSAFAVNCDDLLRGHLRALDFVESGFDERISQGNAPVASEVIQQLLQLAHGGGDTSAIRALQTELPLRPHPIRSLPYLASHTPDLTWLPHLIRDQRLTNIKDLRDLITWAPVWTESPEARDIQLAVLARMRGVMDAAFDLTFFSDLRNAVPLLRWLLDQNIEPELLNPWVKNWTAKLFSRSLSETLANSSITVASLLPLLPYDQIPEEIRERLEKSWVRFDLNPPLQAAVRSTIETKSAGNCMNMFSGHVCTVFPDLLGVEMPLERLAGRYLFIAVNGQILGSIKKAVAGEPSFLAFKNVFGPDGRLMLAAGGVYMLSKRNMDEISKVSGPLHADDGTVKTVHLNDLAARPVSFLLNQNSEIENGALDRIQAHLNPGHTARADRTDASMWTSWRNIQLVLAALKKNSQ